MFSKIRRSQLIAAALTLITATAAHASLLAPGATAPPDFFGPISGTLLASETNPYVSVLGTTDFSGTYTTQVILADTNSVCPLGGCLDFVYQASNAGPLDIVTISGSSFTGFTTDAGFATSAGTLISAPGDISPFDVTRGSTGSTVNFDFLNSNLLGPGKTTDVLVIETNATRFTNGHISFINDGTSTNPAYQPAAVPEPASLALFGTALVGLGFIGFVANRRRSV